MELERRKTELKGKIQLELERLRLEQKTYRCGGKTEEANQAGGSRFADLPHYIDKKNNLDSYVLLFERYATVANWPQINRATQLNALLVGKALDVYSRHLQEDALDMDI